MYLLLLLLLLRCSFAALLLPGQPSAAAVRACPLSCRSAARPARIRCRTGHLFIYLSLLAGFSTSTSLAQWVWATA